MSEEDLNTYKKYVSDLDITKYIVLDSESNYWYSAEYVDKMLKKQDKQIERLNKQLQLISYEFLRYDWENSSKEQIINQLKSLYNSIFKGSDKE